MLFLYREVCKHFLTDLGQPATAALFICVGTSVASKQRGRISGEIINYYRGKMYHDRIKKRMQQVGVKNRVLAALVNISAPKLSLYLKGCCHIKPEKYKELDGTLNALVELQRAFPIPLGMDDATLLEVALERLGKGEFEKFRHLTNLNYREAA